MRRCGVLWLAVGAASFLIGVGAMIDGGLTDVVIGVALVFASAVVVPIGIACLISDGREGEQILHR